MDMIFEKISGPGPYSGVMYACNVTKYLDSHTRAKGLSLKHYALASGRDLASGVLPIRFPGATVGWAAIDEDRNITKILIDTDGYGFFYPDSVNKELEKYVGRHVAFGTEGGSTCGSD